MKALLLVALLALAAGAQDVGRLTKEAARLRGLSCQPVQSRLVTKAECVKYVHKLLEGELKPGPARVLEGFLRELRLLGPKQNLKPLLLDLYSDQIRGLYDPAAKTYLVMKEAANVSELAQSALLQAMGISMVDVYAVHELDHAVQDQHFNLTRLINRVRSNDDRSFALQSLVEGDATAVMMDYLGAGDVDLDPAELAGGGGVLAKAPRYLRDMLTLPYGQGLRFVKALRAEGGWERVNQAYKKLPQSSEQIFHPEKYLAGDDPPVPVSLKGYPREVDGLPMLGENVAGEFSVRVLAAEQQLSMDTAEGWEGDCYRVYGRGKRSIVLWVSLWETPQDAREFAALLKKATRGRQDVRLTVKDKRVEAWTGTTSPP